VSAREADSLAARPAWRWRRRSPEALRPRLSAGLLWAALLRDLFARDRRPVTGCGGASPRGAKKAGQGRQATMDPTTKPSRGPFGSPTGMARWRVR